MSPSRRENKQKVYGITPNITLSLVRLSFPLVSTPASLVRRCENNRLREDSSTALSIISLLDKLTQKGMIVVCSIHQPRSNIFSEFDKVLLLNKGKTVYYGGRSSIAMYFHSLGERFFAPDTTADTAECHVSRVFASSAGVDLPTGIMLASSAGVDLPAGIRNIFAQISSRRFAIADCNAYV